MNALAVADKLFYEGEKQDYSTFHSAWRRSVSFAGCRFVQETNYCL